MKVNIGTIELDELERLALAHALGTTGMATRENVKAWASAVLEDELRGVQGTYLEAKGLAAPSESK